MALISVNDVQRIAGLADADLTTLGITDAQILDHIYDAEEFIQNYCSTAFLDNETSLLSASAGSGTSLTTVGGFTGEDYTGYFVYITSGTGSGQWNEILSNTDDVLTLRDTFGTTPDNTSKYYVVYAPYAINQSGFFNPRQEITIDGTGNDRLYLKRRPLLQLVSLTIDSTSVTPSNVFQYDYEGKLVLSNTAEFTYFSSKTPQLVDVTYYTGQYRTSRLVKHAIGIVSGLRLLIQQMGGTYDDVSTFSMPELSGTIGQAYINIAETVKSLQNEWTRVSKQLPVHSFFG